MVEPERPSAGWAAVRFGESGLQHRGIRSVCSRFKSMVHPPHRAYVVCSSSVLPHCLTCVSAYYFLLRGTCEYTFIALVEIIAQSLQKKFQIYLLRGKVQSSGSIKVCGDKIRYIIKYLYIFRHGEQQVLVVRLIIYIYIHQEPRARHLTHFVLHTHYTTWRYKNQKSQKI